MHENIRCKRNNREHACVKCVAGRSTAGRAAWVSVKVLSEDGNAGEDHDDDGGEDADEGGMCGVR